jgi:hypothetical protein
MQQKFSAGLSALFALGTHCCLAKTETVEKMGSIEKVMILDHPASVVMTQLVFLMDAQAHCSSFINVVLTASEKQNSAG